MFFIFFILIFANSFLSEDKQNPSNDLIDLFVILKIDPPKNKADMNNYLQKNFYRGCQKERWEIASSAYQNQLDRLIPLFKRLGLVDAVKPKNREYDYLVIHGATLSSMRLRVQYAWDLYQQGVKFRHIYFFTGKREGKKLTKEEQELCIKSEREAAEEAWKLFKKDSTIHFVYAGDVKGERANTLDTIQYWFKQYKPKAGSILAISSNPYIPYQDLVFLNKLNAVGWFKEGGSLETVGPESRENRVAIYLDTIAITFYQTLKNNP